MKTIIKKSLSHDSCMVMADAAISSSARVISLPLYAAMSADNSQQEKMVLPVNTKCETLIFVGSFFGSTGFDC